MSPFEAKFEVQWGDLDSNNHLRNTGYLDYAAQTRMLYFAAHDFTPDAFAEHAIGPVVLEDNVSYRRELRLLQPFRVQLACAGLSDNGAKFMLENTFLREDGKLCAKVRSRGIWMDLRSRKTLPPPVGLKRAMEDLVQTDDFAELR